MVLHIRLDAKTISLMCTAPPACVLIHILLHGNNNLKYSYVLYSIIVVVHKAPINDFSPARLKNAAISHYF